MNWSNIESGWNDFKANAKEQWSKISPEQMDDIEGKRERLSLQVQKSYSVSREDADRQITDWQEKQVVKQMAGKQAPAAKS